MAVAPDIRPGSRLRRAEYVQHTDADGTTFAFFDLFDPPEIVPQDDDLLYTVSESDRLDKIAFSAYGNVRLWWVIALANDWDVPWVSLQPGSVIRIPSARYVKENFLR